MKIQTLLYESTMRNSDTLLEQHRTNWSIVTAHVAKGH